MGLGWQHLSIAISIIVGLFAFNWKQSRRFEKLMVEHEMLIGLMCELTGTKREDLPTRHKNGVL